MTSSYLVSDFSKPYVSISSLSVIHTCTHTYMYIEIHNYLDKYPTFNHH